MAFLERFIIDTCWIVHNEWGIEAPFRGYPVAYDLGSWLQDGRMRVKAAQNAHGSNAEVSLWFLVRRRRLDAGYRGEQTYNAYLFEQCTRASLRQHVFCEDLRGSVQLPRKEPFWADGWQLGVRGWEQFVDEFPESVAKRTIKVLKLIRWLEEAVVEQHGVQSIDYVNTYDEQGVPVLMRSRRSQQLIICESHACGQFLTRGNEQMFPIRHALAERSYG